LPPGSAARPHRRPALASESSAQQAESSAQPAESARFTRANARRTHRSPTFLAGSAAGSPGNAGFPYGIRKFPPNSPSAPTGFPGNPAETRPNPPEKQDFHTDSCEKSQASEEIHVDRRDLCTTRWRTVQIVWNSTWKSLISVKPDARSAGKLRKRTSRFRPVAREIPIPAPARCRIVQAQPLYFAHAL
jgi:hypothetical protein